MELVFSYASNLHQGRLQSRLGNAEMLGLASINGYKIDICVKSGDNSAKATLIKTDNKTDEVWGVLTEHTAQQLQHLDKLEGVGLNYQRVRLNVVKESGKVVAAWVYVGKSEYFDNSIQPYEWYLLYIINGAKNLNLPKSYRQNFERFKSKPDPDLERNTMHLQILNSI